MRLAVSSHPERIRLRFDHPLMSKTTGHIIRMIGMLIEMFGVWGVYQASYSKNPWVISVPGAGTMPIAWLPVFAGLIIWLTGVFIVYSYRPTGRKTIDTARNKTGIGDERR
jgi:hypothetical protein